MPVLRPFHRRQVKDRAAVVHIHIMPDMLDFFSLKLQ